MVTVSPPVSPSVVARILMTQKVSVTAGTLLSADETVIGQPRNRYAYAMRDLRARFLNHG
jgi:hypothetical protein